MQRKNSILKQRRGFAMIAAMGVIVVIGTIMALSLSLTTQTAKRTTDIYLYEQSVLLAKSAAELALERIAANPICNPLNVANPSISTINFTHESIYNVNVNMRYFLPSDFTCENVAYFFDPLDPNENTRAHLYGTVMLDVTIRVNDTSITSEPITYFKRTIQKL